jgi:hypothetical protein
MINDTETARHFVPFRMILQSALFLDVLYSVRRQPFQPNTALFFVVDKTIG